MCAPVAFLHRKSLMWKVEAWYFRWWSCSWQREVTKSIAISRTTLRWVRRRLADMSMSSRFYWRMAPRSTPGLLQSLTPYCLQRVKSGQPLVRKTRKCWGIIQMSGKCQGFRWKSGNCWKSFVVEENYQKIFPKIARFHIFKKFICFSLRFCVILQLLLSTPARTIHYVLNSESTGATWPALHNGCDKFWGVGYYFVIFCVIFLYSCFSNITDCSTVNWANELWFGLDCSSV